MEQFALHIAYTLGLLVAGFVVGMIYKAKTMAAVYAAEAKAMVEVKKVP